MDENNLRLNMIKDQIQAEINACFDNLIEAGFKLDKFSFELGYQDGFNRGYEKAIRKVIHDLQQGLPQ